MFADAPRTKPVIKGISKDMVLIADNSSLELSCSIDDGNPIPQLHFDCSNDVNAIQFAFENKTGGTEATLKLAKTTHLNGIVCTCAAKQLITNYTGSTSVTLGVICKYSLSKEVDNVPQIEKVASKYF